MKDIRQSPQYANYLSRVGWTVERVGGVNYFIRKLPLIGSIIKIQRPDLLDIRTARRLGNKYRAFQIIVEPASARQLDSLITHGFKQAKSPFLPSKTLCLDLTKTKEKLFAGLKKDCRQALKKTTYSLLSTSYSPEEFRVSWKKTVGWKRYAPSLSHLIALKESFGDNCLFLLYKNSGAIFLVADGIGYYWQAFTDAEGRKLKAQYKIVWGGIIWAKRKGAKVFDFEGIYDPRFPNKSWLGFTHFKKSFGGYEVEYPGAFVKLRLPL